MQVINITRVPKRLIDYAINDVDDQDTIIYIGMQNQDGEWLIVKIDLTSDTNYVMRYATQKNSGYTTYNDAWTNRTSLTYDIFDNAV